MLTSSLVIFWCDAVATSLDPAASLNGRLSWATSGQPSRPAGRAPEIFFDDEDFGVAADLWSCGLVLAELAGYNFHRGHKTKHLLMKAFSSSSAPLIVRVFSPSSLIPSTPRLPLGRLGRKLSSQGLEAVATSSWMVLCSGILRLG